MATLKRLRWPLLVVYLLAATVAMMFALPAALAAVGLPPQRVSFLPGTITGLPWSVAIPLFRPDSVTTLTILMVSHLLNIAIGLMLARGAGD